MHSASTWAGRRAEATNRVRHYQNRGVAEDYSPSAEEAKESREWWVVDASGKTLGRLVEIATILRGKHKPTFSPHVDGGDFVIVTNCEKIASPATS